METREISLKYGRGEITFSLPAGQIYFEVVGKDYPAVSDIPGAIKSALERPIDSPPLKELLRPTDKVAIAVSDITRSWQRMDLVLPTLLDTISEAGIPDCNINILGLVEVSKNEKFAWDTFRRLIQMFSDVVFGVPSEHFEEILDTEKKKNG